MNKVKMIMMNERLALVLHYLNLKKSECIPFPTLRIPDNFDELNQISNDDRDQARTQYVEPNHMIVMAKQN